MNGKIILLMGILSLAGCSSTTSSIDCKIGSGARCKSVTRVNQMVSSGELLGSNTTGINHGDVLPIREQAKCVRDDMKRFPEKTARVWINGFEDDSGDYVKETYVYTVIEGGSWRNAK